jgi:hypothetical protein
VILDGGGNEPLGYAEVSREASEMSDRGAISSWGCRAKGTMEEEELAISCSWNRRGYEAVDR